MAAHTFGGKALGGLAGTCLWDTIGAFKPRSVVDQIVGPHAFINPEATQIGGPTVLLPCSPTFSTGLSGAAHLLRHGGFSATLGVWQD